MELFWNFGTCLREDDGTADVTGSSKASLCCTFDSRSGNYLCKCTFLSPENASGSVPAICMMIRDLGLKHERAV